MKREIKFKAYIHALGKTIFDVSVYADGMIGLNIEELENILPETHKIMDDEVVHQEDDIYDVVLTFLSGENEWIWLEPGQFDLLEWSGMDDRTGKPVYEGDIAKGWIEGKECVGEIVFKHGAFTLKDRWLIHYDEIEVTGLYVTSKSA